MLTKNDKLPNNVAIRKGLIVKEVIPSRAKAIIFFKGYLDLPAIRS